MYEEAKYANANSTLGTQAVRQPQVYEVLDALEKTVEAHQKLAAELDGRLNPVLRSEPELAESPRDDQKESTVVGLAARVKQTEKVLHRLSAQYNSILRRLEI
jgi:hypothetical protein